MAEHMEQHFLSRHSSRVTISELKRKTLQQCLVGDLGDIVLEPEVGFGDSEMKLSEFRCLRRIRCRVRVLLASQVSAKDSVDNVDVVERPDRRV